MLPQRLWDLSLLAVLLLQLVPLHRSLRLDLSVQPVLLIQFALLDRSVLWGRSLLPSLLAPEVQLVRFLRGFQLVRPVLLPQFLPPCPVGLWGPLILSLPHLPLGLSVRLFHLVQAVPLAQSHLFLQLVLLRLQCLLALSIRWVPFLPAVPEVPVLQTVLEAP